jgi:hypothetical protein
MMLGYIITAFDYTSYQYLNCSRTDDMKCQSKLFLLAEVFWRGQKNPLPFSKIPPCRRGGERKIQDKANDIHGRSHARA